MASETGLSRRDLMKKGAVAGAVVWSAPILTSTPAFASTGCGGSKPCTTYHYCKIDSNGAEVEGNGDGGGNTNNNNNCPRLTAQDLCGELTADGAVVESTGGCQYIEGQFDSNSGTGSFTYLQDASPLAVQIKYGNDCVTIHSHEFGSPKMNGACSFTVSHPAPVEGREGAVKVTITQNTDSCSDISHIGTYFCI